MLRQVVKYVHINGRYVYTYIYACETRSNMSHMSKNFICFQQTVTRICTIARYHRRMYQYRLLDVYRDRDTDELLLK